MAFDRDLYRGCGSGDERTDSGSDRKSVGGRSGKCESAETGNVDPQCADHDDPQFLSVGDSGSFSCDRYRSGIPDRRRGRIEASETGCT